MPLPMVTRCPHHQVPTMHPPKRLGLVFMALISLYHAAPLAAAEFDRDGDSVMDAVDSAPDDANIWLPMANPNGEEAGPGLADTSENLAGIHLLMAKVRDRHVGGGHYELTEGELGYAAYASVRQSATTSARVTGQAGFDGMGITTTTSGEVTNGPSLGDGWVIHRLYFLGLARYLRPGTGAEARIQTFYRWLRWRGFTGASLANYRYMSVTGNAFMMTSDLIPVEDRAYFLNSLWSVTYRDGTLHTLATTGSRDPQALERFRNADVLRSCMHLVLAGILILPETTSAQREVKLAYLAAYRRTIIWAADAAPGIASLLKPDFSGHHHYTSYAAAYSPYGALALAGTAELFRGTPYQLADHHLTHLAGYARELYFYAHLDHTPQGLSGRGESSQSLTEAYSILALMALAGSTPRSDTWRR